MLVALNRKAYEKDRSAYLQKTRKEAGATPRGKPAPGGAKAGPAAGNKKPTPAQAKKAAQDLERTWESAWKYLLARAIRKADVDRLLLLAMICACEGQDQIGDRQVEHWLGTHGGLPLYQTGPGLPDAPDKTVAAVSRLSPGAGLEFAREMLAVSFWDLKKVPAAGPRWKAWT